MLPTGRDALIGVIAEMLEGELTCVRRENRREGAVDWRRRRHRRLECEEGMTARARNAGMAKSANKEAGVDGPAEGNLRRRD